MLQSGTPFRVQALKRFRAEMIVGLATSLSPIVASELFHNVFNVRTEIKLILILILILTLPNL